MRAEGVNNDGSGLGQHIEAAFAAVPVGLRSRFERRYREGFVGDLEDIARKSGRVSFWDQASLYLLRMPDFQDAFKRLDAARADFRGEGK